MLCSINGEMNSIKIRDEFEIEDLLQVKRDSLLLETINSELSPVKKIVTPKRYSFNQTRKILEIK